MTGYERFPEAIIEIPLLSNLIIMESEEDLRARARKIAEDKIGFYIHLVIYLAINTLFIALWLWGGGGFPWFMFPLIFWGIGLVAHGLGVFLGTGFADRMAEKEYRRLKGQR